MKTTLKLGSGAALAFLLACGGGGGSDSGGGSTPPATRKLVYTNPTPTPTQWSLKKNAASTDTHLVLDLVPPSDAVSGFGVALTINAPTASLTWTKVSSGDAQLIHNTAYTLGSSTPQLIKAATKSGDLIAGVYQQGLSTSPVPHASGAVASIALDAASGAAVSASVPLTVKVSKELQGTGMQSIDVAVSPVALQ